MNKPYDSFPPVSLYGYFNFYRKPEMAPQVEVPEIKATSTTSTTTTTTTKEILPVLKPKPPEGNLLC